MDKLKAKLKKQGGFTLIEMLIVVAIIAILIAISIPLVNNALERAKHATDAANERAAKAEIMICYLGDTATPVNAGDVYYYNAVEGSLKTSFADAGKPYGKHTKNDTDRTSSVIAISIDTNGVVTTQWVSTGIASGGAVTADANLCGAQSDYSHS